MEYELRLIENKLEREFYRGELKGSGESLYLMQSALNR